MLLVREGDANTVEKHSESHLATVARVDEIGSASGGWWTKPSKL
jgi:hypothetical protein